MTGDAELRLVKLNCVYYCVLAITTVFFLLSALFQAILIETGISLLQLNATRKGENESKRRVSGTNVTNPILMKAERFCRVSKLYGEYSHLQAANFKTKQIEDEEKKTHSRRIDCKINVK